jgi:1-pyrroline-5-carboxylate dehydrogenase
LANALYRPSKKKDSDAEIIVGGNYDKSKVTSIEPTVIVTTIQNIAP